MNTLASRLGRGLLLSLAVAIGILAGVLDLAARRFAEHYIVSRLEHDAETILVAVRFDAQNQLQVPGERLSLLFRRPFGGHYFLCRVGSETVRSRSWWDFEPQLPAVVPEGAFAMVGPQEQPLLAREFVYRKSGQSVRILVAEEVGDLDRDLARLRLAALGAWLAVLAVLIGVQRHLLRLGLQPMERVREQLRRLHHGEIAQLDESGIPGELLPVVGEVNRLLGVVRQRLERSRRALGNLAHALKTPMTLLVHAVESGRREPVAALELAAEQAERIRFIVDRELKRGRLAGESGVGGSFAVQAEVAGVLVALQRLHAERDLLLDNRVPPGVVIPGDREDLLEMVGNLLDNGCRWAERQVRIEAGATGGYWLTVEDDGPGGEEAVIRRLANSRGRMDESGGGHGLGLAIVREVVEQGHGEITFDRSPELGGLRVRVEWGMRVRHP